MSQKSHQLALAEEARKASAKAAALPKGAGTAAFFAKIARAHEALAAKADAK